MSTSSDIVKLNVGGVLYSTTKSTLCKYPNSMLGAMFNGCMSTTVDENGCHFIDRDGELFRYILNYIRSSRLSLPTGFNELDHLSAEADFYQISQLIEDIETLKQPVVEKCVNTHYLEVIEVRTGTLDAMPTLHSTGWSSRMKTIISGQCDVIHKYLSPHQIHPAARLNSGKDYTEIALTGNCTRLQVGVCLLNQGWKLSDSKMSTFSSKEEDVHLSSKVTYETHVTLLHKDRWCITL